MRDCKICPRIDESEVKKLKKDAEATKTLNRGQSEFMDTGEGGATQSEGTPFVIRTLIIRGIQVASFLRLYFGPICKRRTALKHPEIVVKKKNSPEPVPTHGTWRAVLQCEIWSLDFCLPLNMIFDAGLFFFLPKCHE